MGGCASAVRILAIYGAEAVSGFIGDAIIIAVTGHVGIQNQLHRWSRCQSLDVHIVGSSNGLGIADRESEPGEALLPEPTVGTIWRKRIPHDEFITI